MKQSLTKQKREKKLKFFFRLFFSFWHRSALAVGEKLVYSNKLHTQIGWSSQMSECARIYITLKCAMAHKRLIWNLNIIQNFNLMFWFTSEINSFDRRDYFLLKQSDDEKKKIKKTRENLWWVLCFKWEPFQSL